VTDLLYWLINLVMSAVTVSKSVSTGGAVACDGAAGGGGGVRQRVRG